MSDDGGGVPIRCRICHVEFSGDRFLANRRLTVHYQREHPTQLRRVKRWLQSVSSTFPNVTSEEVHGRKGSETYWSESEGRYLFRS